MSSFQNGVSIVTVNKVKEYSDTIDGTHFKNLIFKSSDLFEPNITETDNCIFSIYGKLSLENRHLVDNINYFKIGDSIFKMRVDTVHKAISYRYKGRSLNLIETSKDLFKINSVSDSVFYLQGLIDTFGHEILPLEYFTINHGNHYLEFVHINGDCGVMNLQGKIIFKEDNIGMEAIKYKYGKISYYKRLKKEIYNQNLEPIQRTIYRSIIDTFHNVVFPLDTYDILEIINENLYFIDGFIYKGKEKVNNIKFDRVENFGSNLYKVMIGKSHLTGYKFGYIDANGKIVIPPIYKYLDNFIGKYLLVYVDSLAICYNRKGEIVDLERRYKFLDLEKLPIIDIIYGDTAYMFPIENDYGIFYTLKDNAPNAYYKVYEKVNSENNKLKKSIWYEGYFIETLRHGKIKTYFNSEIDKIENFNFGRLKLE